MRASDPCESYEGRSGSLQPILGQGPGATGKTRKLPECCSHLLKDASDFLLQSKFSDLVSCGHVELLEIACSQDSIISQRMQALTGREDAAMRLSLWNGCDLSKGSGVKRAIQIIDGYRPKHVWISPVCGPYSVMQNINQRTPEQCEDLQEKRRDALKQYVDCSLIYHYAVGKGCHATWEWSQTCQGWRLPVIKTLMEKFQPYFAIVRGCRVNLKDEHGKYIQKGWKIMTTHQLLSQAMNLPCQCEKGTCHVPCEGKLTTKTQYYTVEFANKVCRTLLKDQTKQDLLKTLSGKTTLGEFFGEGPTCECKQGQLHEAQLTCGQCMHEDLKFLVGSHEDPEALVEGNRDADMQLPHRLSEGEIQKRLCLLHSATGHGPVRFLVQALRQRGVSGEVLEAAKRFQCPTCLEKSRPQPRPLSSLEPHPPKWSTVSIDMGHWENPRSKECVQFLMVVDEGSRFRVGRSCMQTQHKSCKVSERAGFNILDSQVL